MIVKWIQEYYRAEVIALTLDLGQQGDYHLSTPMGRAILGKKAVEIAKQEQADAIAHGCIAVPEQICRQGKFVRYTIIACYGAK